MRKLKLPGNWKSTGQAEDATLCRLKTWASRASAQGSLPGVIPEKAFIFKKDAQWENRKHYSILYNTPSSGTFIIFITWQWSGIQQAKTYQTKVCNKTMDQLSTPGEQQWYPNIQQRGYPKVQKLVLQVFSCRCKIGVSTVSTLHSSLHVIFWWGCLCSNYYLLHSDHCQMKCERVSSAVIMSKQRCGELNHNQSLN